MNNAEIQGIEYFDLNSISSKITYTLSIGNISYGDVSRQKIDIATDIYTLRDDNKIYSRQIPEISIPVSIITGNSSFESIVVYLKERLDIKFTDIATMLHRDHRTIWASYTHAKKKNISQKIDPNSIRIPVSILAPRTLSNLETIILYLKTTYNMSFDQIAEMLGKKYQTIWTVYRRGIRKLTK